MTYGIGTLDYAPHPRGRSVGAVFRQTLPGTLAVACGALVSAYILYGRPDTAPSYREALDRVAAPAPGIRVAAQAARREVPNLGAAALSGIRAAAQAGPSVRVARAPQNPYGALLDPGLASGAASLFGDSAPLGSEFALLPSLPLSADDDGVSDPGAMEPQVAEAVPMPIRRPADQSAGPDAAQVAAAPFVPVPAPRPSEFRLPASSAPIPAPVRQMAEHNRPAAPPAVASAAPTPADNRGFFEKLFNVQPQRSGSLAYASAEEGAIGGRGIIPNGMSPYDHWTAIYNIATHTVYLPNGTRLEAHSGLGGIIDDPRHVSEKNRGATPPAVYDLQPREQLFHGVQALRLTPVSGQVYGRVGLLAHTFMLGPTGASNGCVSFRNYNAFLQAYMNGEVKRLVVVAGL